MNPWLKDWLDYLNETVGKDGCEEWLRIAWESGLDDIFQRVANQLILGSSADGIWFFVTAYGRILTEVMLPGIIGNSRDYNSVWLVYSNDVNAESILDVRTAKTKNGFEILRSVNAVLKQLRELRILNYPSGHYNCGFEAEMKGRINHISQDMPAVMLEVHRQHLEAQRTKCSPWDEGD